MNRSNSILEPLRNHAFRQRLVSLVSLFFFASLSPAVETSLLQAQTTTLPVQQDLEKTVAEAKREGKVVISIPASAELRKQLEDGFRKRFDLDVEVFTARGSAAVRKMADEFKAGVRYFDLHIGGSSSAVSGLLDEAILDPVENWLALTEVKDPKQWWGGHLWVDQSKKFIYL